MVGFMVPERCIIRFCSIDMRENLWTAIGKAMGWSFIEMEVGIRANLKGISETGRAS